MAHSFLYKIRTYVLTNECSRLIIQISKKEQLFGKRVRTVGALESARVGRAYLMYGRKFRYERRRAYERKRNFLILVSGLCLALAFAFLFGSFLSQAGAKESDTIYYKYYTNIEIQPGETLWDLAEDYMGDQYESRAVYVAEVRQINGIADSDSIVSGQYLIMPYYSAEYK